MLDQLRARNLSCTLRFLGVRGCHEHIRYYFAILDEQSSVCRISIAV